MEIIKTNSIAKGVAGATPIILREGPKTRLLFRPLLIENKTNPNNNIKGTFIYQKKSKNDSWEDSENIGLSSLRQGEGYKLELSSSEISILLGGIEKFKEIYQAHGIQQGENNFFITDKNIENIIDKLGNAQNEEVLITALKNTNKETIDNIEKSINIARFQKIIKEIEENLDNGDEKNFWQPLFKRESWILSQLFSVPSILIGDEIYLGGKTIDNTGGVITDYGYKNIITQSISIIEVKNPCESLIEKNSYRGGKNENDSNTVYSLSKNFTGAISQILNQKYIFLKEQNALSLGNLKTYNIKSILLIGLIKGLNESQKKTFELHRSSMKDIEIITFDELLEKIKLLFNLLKNEQEFNVNKINNKDNEIEKSIEIEDIPF